MSAAPPRIVYLQRATLEAVKMRRPAFAHEWIEYAATPLAAMGERVAGATVAIVNKVRLAREAIEAAPALRLVAVAATGTDSVDLEACRARGIAVTNVRDYARHSVAEHAMMLMLCAMRGTAAYTRRVRAGDWSRAGHFFLDGPPIGELHGRTLAIVGRGVLGEATAALARGFGMRVIYAERKGRAEAREGFVPFMAALAGADVVSLHCPLTQGNERLIGAAELAAMKPTAVLVNTARGRLVDEPALVAALREGRLAGAAVDVVWEEPPVNGNLLIDADLPNLLVTPHIAWASAQARQRLADELIDAIEAWHRGESMNRVV